ncbi:hypothetical protein JW872_00940 [Candidatus Babeliales bacterium]|nr:hypothetical protein [Candidatus Babeliales bacterium]
MKYPMFFALSFCGLIMSYDNQENIMLDMVLTDNGEVITHPQLIIPSTGETGCIELKNDEAGIYVEVGATRNENQVCLHVRCGSLKENTRTLYSDSEFFTLFGDAVNLQISDETGYLLELSIVPSLAKSELE